MKVCWLGCDGSQVSKTAMTMRRGRGEGLKKADGQDSQSYLGLWLTIQRLQNALLLLLLHHVVVVVVVVVVCFLLLLLLFLSFSCLHF